VADPRRKEEPRKVFHVCGAVERVPDGFVVVDRPLWEDQRVIPAMPDEHLATGVPERRQVGLVGADEVVELLERLAEEAVGAASRS
jgi:hypothetical protein